MMQYMESFVGFVIIIYVLVMTDTMTSKFSKVFNEQQKKVDLQNCQIEILKEKLDAWKIRYETDMDTFKEQTSDELVVCNERIVCLEKTCEKYKKYQRKVIIDDSSEDETQLSDTESEDEIICCIGCLEHQPNQEAHMGPGGCMDIDDF